MGVPQIVRPVQASLRTAQEGVNLGSQGYSSKDFSVSTSFDE